MLDRQYHLYAVDTAYFYSNCEKYYHDMNCKYRMEQHTLQNRLTEMEKELRRLGFTSADLKNFQKGKSEKAAPASSSGPMISQYIHLINLIKHKRKKAKESKKKLLALFANKVTQNEKTDGKDHIRTLREDQLNDTDVISAFDSALSRTIGIAPDELTDACILVQVYYFDVFKDLSFFGFTYKGEPYRYFTSSAGQIRTKKALFIKEAVWRRIEKTIMCGLTIDKINAKGGNNVNKHLAYMALTNSATDEWTDFDIDRSIVIDDFETNVRGVFDFVDETDYSITRKAGEIPIPHTDGAGMILPNVSTKNFMFRAPWIKGLLGVFDFRRFVKINHCSPVITDVYGMEHDIFKEDIQIIFTKSQFKMYKYYNSWEEYKTYFKAYHCAAGICNVEEDRIKNAKINYQMLQTLTDITEEEIDLITQRSAERIRDICSSKKSMLELLGITPYNTNMTPFQKAIRLYPALLNDTYAKDVIREVKNSLLKKYRSGKLEVNGKYTFLLPDYYAACEYWFGHIEKPDGLLADQEVFCHLFSHAEKLDCLRSPHLYKEHAIRHNIAYEGYGERAGHIREWFLTNGIYASTHDLITKLLMYDVDGDKSLVVADPDFISIAERNMKGIVPLYYNMKKSEPTELNRQTIYAGLHAAFTGGNIGTYSNHIAKIWNSDVFLMGSEEEKQEAIDCVKRLCCQNNFVIDFAKTLYKPDFPPKIREQIAKYTNAKLPAFFAFAKDKEPAQLETRNKSFVNRIYDKIPNRPINTRSMKLEPLDYQKMMGDRQTICPKEVSALYDALNRQYRYMMNRTAHDTDNLRYSARKIRDAFSRFGYSEETIADMLVAYLYGRNKRYKQLLWFCYGHYLVAHLEANPDVPKIKEVQCIDCGDWMEVPISSKSIRCPSCQKTARSRINRINYLKRKYSNAFRPVDAALFRPQEMGESGQ